MGLLDGLKDLRPPGADIALLALLLAANALTGGGFGGIDVSGSDLHVTEIGLALVLALAIARLGPRRAWQVFRERSAPIWIGLFVLAGLVAMARGLAEFNGGAVLYDVQLYFFVATVPVVVLCADTRERATWLLKAMVVIVAVAMLMFLASELISRAWDAESPLADQEGEIGAGGFYACFVVAWVLSGLTLGRLVSWPEIALGCAAVAMIGISEKRMAWVALVAMLLLLVPLAWRARRIVLPAVAATAVLAAGATVVIDAVAGSKAPVVIDGPLEGDFESNGRGWRALGSAEPTGPFVNREWSAEGEASLGARFEASEDYDSGYLFARSCCLSDGGLDADPGTRYRISAVVNAEEAPAKGVVMGVNFFSDDGTYDHPPADYSRGRVRAGEEKTLRLSTTAPPRGEVLGLLIGPKTYRAGDVGEFSIDRVKVQAAGVPGNISTTGEGSDEAGGDSQLKRELGGFLGGDGEEGQNVEWRLDFWAELLGRLGEEPAELIAGAGMGPAEYVREDRAYDFRKPDSSYSNNTTGPHNLFVAVLYMTGIIGLIGLLGLLVTTTVALVRGLREADDQGRRALVALALMSVTGLVFALLSESPRTPELATFAWTAVGLILALAPLARPGDPPQPD